MKAKLFKLQFVDSIPHQLEEDVLYVSIQHNMVSHLCACGCGRRVDTPLDTDEWKLTYDGESISLQPSIGNYDFPCKTHYWIKNNIAVPVHVSSRKQYQKKKKNKIIKSFEKNFKKLFSFL